ncbi:hypothetical protein [Secundilactobacillus folii]|uniref:Prenylated flavin chaperone LpdD-like domain-containing protein n=1 Tax=Secundilactobacillus folii TaxID=2678357 RepID=A0A7X3C2E4_9LACO|nr:hypothetical protein [Secundilactobacillus folii]MTV81407.1 hypothetical protein [Secundilactobacillus folii]
MTQTFESTRAGVTLRAVLERQNQDVLIQLIGGDVPHYGVVTTVDLHGHEQTVALPSRPGHVHQEGVLTRQLAKRIKPALQSNAFIVSGVHVNVISKAQMAAMGPIVNELGDQIRDWLTAHPRQKVPEKFAK